MQTTVGGVDFGITTGTAVSDTGRKQGTWSTFGMMVEGGREASRWEHFAWSTAAFIHHSLCRLGLVVGAASAPFSSREGIYILVV